MTSKADKSIILDLTKSLSSGVISSDSILQVDAKNRLDELLEEFKGQHSSINVTDSAFDYPRFNNTIFVSGQRGAGKTTFLKSYLSELNKKSLDGHDILPVALIDPTLIHTNQPILVEIISCLKRSFENSLSGCGNSDKHHEFSAKLGELSEGLKLLKVKKDDVDQDAAWFLSKALKNADSGQSLERNLHQLIDNIIRSLNKNLLVIAIDDVDNDTNKAQDVLETIRKYLTHPNLVIVVSGDLKIYSHIVKMKKLAELSSDRLTEDNQTNELVEHLEQQYLVKVFPAEQRIYLKNLLDIVENTDRAIFVKTSFSPKRILLLKALEHLLTSYLKIDESFISTYKYFILEQPIRTILQFFKTVDFNWKNPECSKNLSDFVINSYIGLLHKEQINTDKLSSKALHQNDIGLADFKLNSKYGELETGYYSRTDGEQDSYNASQLFLSTVKANYLINQRSELGAAIQLMIATGATSNIYLNYVADKLKERADKQDYIDFIGINRYTTPTSLVPHFSPLILDKIRQNRPEILGGIARLPRSSKPKGNEFEPLLKELFDQSEGDLTSSYGVKEILDALSNPTISTKRIKTLNDLNRWQEDQDTTFLEFLSSKTITMASHSTFTKSEGRDYVSAYLLLAVLGELLESYTNEEKLSSLITKFSSIQTFSSPSFTNTEAQGDGGNSNEAIEDFSLEDGVTTEAENDNYLKFNNLLAKWVELSNYRSGDMSTLLVGKAWSRIHYTLNNVSELAQTRKHKTGNSSPHYVLLGELMTRWVTGIINSVLIEEVRHKPELNKSLIQTLNTAKNVATSSREFEKNLKNVLDKINIDNLQETLPLTYCFLMCPLFWPFYLAEIRNAETIKDALSRDIESNYSEFNEDLMEAYEQNHRGLAFVSRLPILGWS